jgi:hypothetical protein
MPSDALPDDLETLKAMLLAERMQNERLRQIDDAQSFSTLTDVVENKKHLYNLPP